ncbi:MAG: PilW family protein [Candidatus Methylomirabilales bacterium]
MQQPRQRQRAGARGFTILETLVSMSIFLVVMYGVYTVYDVGQENYERGSRQWDVQSQARVAMERMAREIRMAGYDSPNKPPDAILIATADTITIRANLGAGLQYVTYSRRDCTGALGNTLYRNASTTTYCGGDAFIDGVTALTFAFYEMNGVALATMPLDGQAHVTGSGTPSTPAAGSDRKKVRQVKIALTAQQTVGGHVVPFTVTTDVALRNMVP